MSTPTIPYVRIGREYGDKQISLSDSIGFSPEARFAMSMIERWGLVAAEDGGEDTAGRQKARLLTPTELVERAFETARIAVQTAIERGLTVDLPDPNVINAARDEKEAADA